MMTTKAENSSEDNRPPQSTGGGVLRSSGGNGDISLKNSVKLREWVGVEDEVEAAALDFIRVTFGNESYLALLDPGATISLVCSPILNKYRDRLRESSGHIRGVCGVPMKVQGNLRISIDVDGHLGTLEFRAVEEINHDIILGMGFGIEWDLSLRFRAKQWKSGDYGEWHPFAINVAGSTPGIKAECTGLTERTPSDAERIKEIVDRLIHKPTVSYLLATHLTEHHIELTDYTPIRHAPKRRSPAMWTVAQEAVREMH